MQNDSRAAAIRGPKDLERTALQLDCIANAEPDIAAIKIQNIVMPLKTTCWPIIALETEIE